MRPNYIVKFQLAPEIIVDPPVTRTLSCPPKMSMYALHEALQIAFGWTERHSFQFDFEQPDNGLDAEDFMSDTSGCYWEERYLIVDPAKIRRYRRKGGVVRPAHECSVQTLIGDPSLSGKTSSPLSKEY